MANFALASPSVFAENLDGSWIKVLKTGKTGNAKPNEEFTTDDLDAMVRNYEPGSDEIPLGLQSDFPGAQAFGQVDELRRDGDTLMAKVSRVNPKLAELYADGALPKVRSTVERTPQGYALRRVGLCSDDNMTAASIDAEHGARFNKVSVEMSDGLASRAIARLKDRRLWRPELDRSHFSELFEALQGSNRVIEFGEGDQKRTLPAMAALSALVEYITPILDSAADIDLVADAKRISRERGISFSEAVDIAEEARVWSVRKVQFAEGSRSGKYSGVGLHEAARALSLSRGVSYGEALAEVAQDRPDLTMS